MKTNPQQFAAILKTLKRGDHVSTPNLKAWLTDAEMISHQLYGIDVYHLVASDLLNWANKVERDLLNRKKNRDG